MPRQYTPRIDVTCRRCGKVWPVKASHAEATRYCSKACQNGPRLDVPCATCGARLNLAMNRGTGNHYCGQACRVESRRRLAKLYPRSKKPERETLCHLYEVERLATREIAAQFGVSHMTVKRWLRADSISARPTGRGLVNRGIREPTAVDLREMVEVGGSSFDTIAARYGVHPSAVGHWFARHNITPPASHWRTERLVCSDGDRVRSYYELRVDNWLSARNLPHVYEPTVPFSRHSRADFLVGDWYIEIWGVTGSASYDARKAMKRDLYARHHLPLLELEASDFSGLWEQRLSHLFTPDR